MTWTHLVWNSSVIFRLNTKQLLDQHITPGPGRAMVQATSRRPGFDPVSLHVEFVVDIMALGQVFSEYFGFPLSISFHRRSIKMEKRKILISSSQGCTISLQGCGASVAFATGPFNETNIFPS
jgi:hypothetical protein